MKAGLSKYGLTLAGSVGGHDSSVAALGARHSVLGLGTLETVLRARATVAAVEHEQCIANRTQHHILLRRLDAVTTVEWTL